MYIWSCLHQSYFQPVAAAPQTSSNPFSLNIKRDAERRTYIIFNDKIQQLFNTSRRMSERLTP